MTNNDELNQLITKARALGATVEVQHDIDALLDEGREVVDAVRVQGTKGVGPEWMSAVGAAERLREFCAA